MGDPAPAVSSLEEALDHVMQQEPGAQSQEGAEGALAGRRSYRGAKLGVTKHKRTQRFEAHIWHDKKQIYLGAYDTEVQAARGHDVMALRCKGGVCELNYPRQDYDPLLPFLVHKPQAEVVAALRNYSKALTSRQRAFGGGPQAGGGRKRKQPPPTPPTPQLVPQQGAAPTWEGGVAGIGTRRARQQQQQQQQQWQQVAAAPGSGWQVGVGVGPGGGSMAWAESGVAVEGGVGSPFFPLSIRPLKLSPRQQQQQRQRQQGALPGAAAAAAGSDAAAQLLDSSLAAGRAESAQLPPRATLMASGSLGQHSPLSPTSTMAVKNLLALANQAPPSPLGPPPAMPPPPRPPPPRAAPRSLTAAAASPPTPGLTPTPGRPVLAFGPGFAAPGARSPLGLSPLGQSPLGAFCRGTAAPPPPAAFLQQLQVSPGKLQQFLVGPMPPFAPLGSLQMPSYEGLPLGVSLPHTPLQQQMQQLPPHQLPPTASLTLDAAPQAASIALPLMVAPEAAALAVPKTAGAAAAAATIGPLPADGGVTEAVPGVPLDVEDFAQAWLAGVPAAAGAAGSAAPGVGDSPMGASPVGVPAEQQEQQQGQQQLQQVGVPSPPLSLPQELGSGATAVELLGGLLPPELAARAAQELLNLEVLLQASPPTPAQPFAVQPPAEQPPAL